MSPLRVLYLLKKIQISLILNIIKGKFQSNELKKRLSKIKNKKTALYKLKTHFPQIWIIRLTRMLKVGAFRVAVVVSSASATQSSCSEWTSGFQVHPRCLCWREERRKSLNVQYDSPQQSVRGGGGDVIGGSGGGGSQLWFRKQKGDEGGGGGGRGYGREVGLKKKKAAAAHMERWGTCWVWPMVTGDAGLWMTHRGFYAHNTPCNTQAHHVCTRALALWALELRAHPSRRKLTSLMPHKVNAGRRGGSGWLTLQRYHSSSPLPHHTHTHTHKQRRRIYHLDATHILPTSWEPPIWNSDWQREASADCLSQGDGSSLAGCSGFEGKQGPT